MPRREHVENRRTGGTRPPVRDPDLDADEDTTSLCAEDAVVVGTRRLHGQLKIRARMYLLKPDLVLLPHHVALLPGDLRGRRRRLCRTLRVPASKSSQDEGDCRDD